MSIVESMQREYDKLLAYCRELEIENAKLKAAPAPNAGKESESIPLHPKALPLAAVGQEPPYVAWLIERGSPAEFYNGVTDTWVGDANKATKYSSEEHALHASDVYETRGNITTRICDHQFNCGTETLEKFHALHPAIAVVPFDPSMIPVEIIDAARKVERFFLRMAVTKWKLEGIESRDYPTPPIAPQDKAAPSTLAAGTAREWWILEGRDPEILNDKPITPGYVHVREIVATQNAERTTTPSRCTQDQTDGACG